jgi:hypothetical protein
MNKAELFLLFLPVAVLTAGLFGMVHNQISYSVSNEYFTKFKFIQFRLLDSTIPEEFVPPKLGFLHSGGWEFRSVFSAVRWFHSTITEADAGTISLASYRTLVCPSPRTGTSRFPLRRLHPQLGLYRRSRSIPAAWIFHLVFRGHN